MSWCEVVVLVIVMSVSVILHSISPQKTVVLVVTYRAVLCCLCGQNSTIIYVIHQHDNSTRDIQPIKMFSLIPKWIILFKIMNFNAVVWCFNVVRSSRMGTRWCIVVRCWIRARPILVFSGFSVYQISEIKLSNSTCCGHGNASFHPKMFVTVLLTWKHMMNMDR